MANSFAVIKTGGKQYKVSEGQRIKVEKLSDTGAGGAESDSAVFDDVLLAADGGKISIGQPKVEGAKVAAKVAKQGRGRKIIILKYRPKKRYKKKQGHRQYYTEVQITKIQNDTLCRPKGEARGISKEILRYAQDDGKPSFRLLSRHFRERSEC